MFQALGVTKKTGEAVWPKVNGQVTRILRAEPRRGQVPCRSVHRTAGVWSFLVGGSSEDAGRFVGCLFVMCVAYSAFMARAFALNVDYPRGIGCGFRCSSTLLVGG